MHMDGNFWIHLRLHPPAPGAMRAIMTGEFFIKTIVIFQLSELLKSNAPRQRKPIASF